MTNSRPSIDKCDFLVIGSGGAGLTAALRAAQAGLSVKVIEKTAMIGGTTAMSGAGIWIPANHVALKAGIDDSQEEALAYIRAASPDGWEQKEDLLWRAFVANGPKMLNFVDNCTPLSFKLTNEPDPFAELPGGKARGRQLTVKPLTRWKTGKFARRIRSTTLVNVFNYDEIVSLDPYHNPIRAIVKLWPKVLWRMLANIRGQGNALVNGLIQGCLGLGVDFVLETPAMALVQDDTGRVTGAVVEDNAGCRTIFARSGVLLATGGFEWNATLREQHFPGGVNFLGSPAAHTGDGQIMAEQAGAALDRMDQANIYPCLPTVYEGRSTGLPMTFTAEKHAILVNRQGHRFVSEHDFNIGERMDERDPDTGDPVHLPVWLIGDSRFLKQSLPFRWYARKRKDWVLQADTLNALAEGTKLPCDALSDTVDRFNHFCEENCDKDFNRGQSTWDKYKTHGAGVALTDITVPPFVAVEVSRSILGTKGGARTDERARVLRPDGSLILGLYAAGLAMANPIGTRAIGAGTTIGPNMTWGFIAAEDAVRSSNAPNPSSVETTPSAE